MGSEVGSGVFCGLGWSGVLNLDIEGVQWRVVQSGVKCAL
jgi:hypothetical protein